MGALIRAFIVKIAQRCNLNCSYCYMYNHADRSFRSKPAFMATETFTALVHRIAQYMELREINRVSIILHGGEPMLIQPALLDHWLQYCRHILGDRVELGIQTNGTLVNAGWTELFLRHAIEPAISIDGTAEAHDAFRVDHLGRGSYHRVLNGLQQLWQAGIAPGVLCVINPWCSGLEVYGHLRSLGINRIEFLLPDATHDSKPLLFSGCGETPVADYLIPVFDAWFAEDNPDVRVRFFLDVIRVLEGGAPVTDNLGAATRGQDYIVIDTDGTIQVTDVLKICFEGAAESRMNVLANSLDELDRTHSAPFRELLAGIRLCDTCRRCPEGDVCRGGALPHRYSRARGFDNPSVWCKDMLMLISHIRNAMTQFPAAV